MGVQSTITIDSVSPPQPASAETSRGEAVPAVRVFVADQQALFRDGIRLTLAEAAQIELVGEAPTVREALAQLDATAPDVVLVDTDLPLHGAASGAGLLAEGGGIELARQVKHRRPATGIIMLATLEDEEQLFHAIKVGAAAYVRRDVTPEALVEIIRRVHQGEFLISDRVLERPQVTALVLKQFRELAATQDEAEPLFVPLSGREIEILDYIAHGQSNKEIAQKLSISDQTVKNHITSILRKLAVNDRTQAVIYALRNNWIRL